MLKQARRDKDRKRLKEIVEFVKRGKGTELKWLRSSVRLLNAIPQSSSGKILLRMLRGDVNKEQEGGKERESYDIFFISISAVFVWRNVRYVCKHACDKQLLLLTNYPLVR